MRTGMIGVSSNSKGLFPKLVRFFTKSEYSHTFIIQQPLGNIETVQEASDLVQIVPFERNYTYSLYEHYKLFKMKNVSEDLQRQALDRVFKELSGEKYGKFQVLWFVWRWFAEKILKKDVSKGQNWFTDGVICSELVYYYIDYCGLGQLLKDFSPNTIQAEDIYQILIKNPDYFEFFEEKVS